MLNSINSDLIRGHIDTIILSVLNVGDRYGYEILGEIDEKSNGHYKIKQPTLYSCLKRLETQGFIYSYRGDEADTGGGRRKYYALTEMGKELFHKNQHDWEYSRTVIDSLISDKEFQFTPISHDDIENHAQPTETEIVEDVAATDTFAQEQEAELFDTENIDDCDENVIEPIIEEPFYDEEDGDANIASKASADIQDDGSDNIDTYFDNADGTSYIEKVSANDSYQSDAGTDFASPIQIHNYIEGIEEEYANEMTDLNEFDFSESEIGDEQEDSVDFKSYDVDIRDVQEYNSEINSGGHGKSLLQRLEEASRQRKEQEQNNSQNAPAQQSNSLQDNNYDSDNSIVINREYKNIIKQLLSGNESVTNEVAATRGALLNDSSSASTELSQKQWRQKANFDKVANSTRNMGDDIKIRTYDSGADKEYTNTYYYFPNRLMLYHYGILFILMMVEILVPYLIIKLGVGINSAGDIPILIISCVIAACLPIYAVIMNFRQPFKRKRYNLDFRNSFWFRMILFAIILFIIYLFNIVFKMDVANPINYLTSLIIPALLATNVPLSVIIFKALYNTKKFNTD